MWSASHRRQIDSRRTGPVAAGGRQTTSEPSGKTIVGTRYRPNERPLQLTKQDLLALPGIVNGFNGFYQKRGVYVLMNQNRILILLGIGAIVLLVAIILILRALWRWLRSPAAAK